MVNAGRVTPCGAISVSVVVARPGGAAAARIPYTSHPGAAPLRRTTGSQLGSVALVTVQPPVPSTCTESSRTAVSATLRSTDTPVRANRGAAATPRLPLPVRSTVTAGPEAVSESTVTTIPRATSS